MREFFYFNYVVPILYIPVRHLRNGRNVRIPDTWPYAHFRIFRALMGCYRYYAHAEMVLPLQPIGGFQRFRNRFYKKANPTTYRLAFYKGHKSSTLKGSLQFGRVLIDTFLLINLFLLHTFFDDAAFLD